MRQLDELWSNQKLTAKAVGDGQLAKARLVRHP